VSSDSIKLFIIVFALLNLFHMLSLSAEESSSLLREDFNDLKNWEPFHFEKIEKHTEYSISEGESGSYLKAESDSSASGIIYTKEFSIYEYPKVKWLWKISNVYKNGNAEEKSGDDYPIRIYIVFKYDPEKASFFQRVKYGAYKKIYGEYPPHSSINYIWANREHKERILTNTYSDETKMIILRSGEESAGIWQNEEVDIIKDYIKAFGEEPPSTARIAIMNDSDNTGEHSISYIDHIEIHR